MCDIDISSAQYQPVAESEVASVVIWPNVVFLLTLHWLYFHYHFKRIQAYFNSVS